MTPQPEQQFRDKLATADKSGQRLWVYPTQPKGRYYKYRTWLSFLLLAFLFGAPFVQLNGHQLLQFNIIERKFFIFGVAFWPQDLFLFALAALSFVVFVVLFTAIFGRLFCGWFCPQTVFLEMLFRKIEYFIEGNAERQRELDRRPVDADKFFRKAAKHTIFFGIAFLIGNTFLAYIVGSHELIRIVTDPPSEHLVGLFFMLLFSLVFYWVFAWFREQACTFVCPYGRLQSVLIDRQSTIVAYDYNRGEPRGALGRGQSFANRGHCIDCSACVKVCPTGIDIRNGTQLECVNCTACIDACDRVMTRMKLPAGLIRYTSEARLAGENPSRFTGRVVIYSSALTVLLTVFAVLMLGRTEIETTVLRARGSLIQQTETNTFRNLYSAKFVNKTSVEVPVTLHLESHAGTIQMVGPEIVVPSEGIFETAFFVEIPETELHSANSLITIEAIAIDGHVIEEIHTGFPGPQKGRTHDSK